MTPPYKEPGLARLVGRMVVNSRVTTRRARKQNEKGAETAGWVRQTFADNTWLMPLVVFCALSLAHRIGLLP